MQFNNYEGIIFNYYIHLRGIINKTQFSTADTLYYIYL